MKQATWHAVWSNKPIEVKIHTLWTSNVYLLILIWCLLVFGANIKPKTTSKRWSNNKSRQPLVMKWPTAVYIQVPLFLSLLCNCWSHQFDWSPQRYGRPSNRKLWLIMGCLRSLFPWLQTLFQSYCPLARGPNLSWASEHGWGGALLDY